MKKFFLLTFFLGIVCSQSLSAQGVRFGIKGGMNLAILEGALNIRSNLKPGILLGASTTFPLANRWALQPELLYSGQGAKFYYLHPKTFAKLEGSTNVSLSYLNLPVFIKFSVSDKFNVHLGPQVGVLLSSKEKGEVDGEMIDDDLNYIIKNGEFALVAGLEVNLSSAIQLGGRFSYGITDIYGGYDDVLAGIFYPPLKNRVIQLYVGYTFR